jgi:ribosome maturation factor RimP
MTARPPHGRRPQEGDGRKPGSTPAARSARGSAPRKPDSGRRDAVLALLAPVVAAAGLELEDVELRTVGRRLVMRVLVDSDTGVSLDQVATASTAVSEILDGSTVLGDEPYTLEVSSPGVDRPLTLPRHWRRSVGRLVTVTQDGGATTTGRITELTDDEVTLEIDEKGRKRRTTLALRTVTRAVVQVEFSRVAAVDLGDDEDDGDDADDASDEHDADEAEGADEADDEADADDDTAGIDDADDTHEIED